MATGAAGSGARGHDEAVPSEQDPPEPPEAHGAAPGEAPPLPPDPEQYDAPRNVRARQKGLPTPYIPGGQDPDLAQSRRRERPYLQLLVLMAVVLVLLGFVLGIASALVTGGAAG
jgi:hypothetical protein